MHSPTKIRLDGQEFTVLAHATAPDGAIRFQCEMDEATREKIELLEGNVPLTQAKIVAATIELVVRPDAQI